MKDFIEHIQKSIYSPEYYRDLTERPASHSWKYYGSLAMFLATLMTIVTSLPLIPRLNTFLAALPEKVVSYYPHELRVDIAGGEVSSNVAEPYFIDFPGSPSSQATTSPLLRLAVIDTKSTSSLEQYSAYNVVFWLSGHSVIALDNDNKLRSVDLGNTTGTIDAPHIRAWISDVEPYFAVLTPILVIVIFLGMLLSFVAMLVYLLFDALCVFLMGKVMKKGWSYRDAYHISLHAVTLPLLLSSFIFILPVSSFQLPLLSTALVLLVVYMNYRGVSTDVEAYKREG